MRTSINPPNLHREISFSQSFQYHNHQQISNYQSPAIAIQQKIQSTTKNKDIDHTQSPPHNLHFKYMPTCGKIEEFGSKTFTQMQMLKQRQQTYRKIENSCQINQRIKSILVDIEAQQNRKSQFSQTFAKGTPQNKESTFRIHGKIMKTRLPQASNKYQLPSNLYNKHSKRELYRQKQNQYCTPTKFKHPTYQQHSNNLSNLNFDSFSKSPLTEKKLNPNDLSAKKYNNIQKNSSNILKNSVYANLIEKRNQKSKENAEMINEVNIQEQMQRIDSKIKQLERIKKQLQTELPQKKKVEQNKVFESQLTKNSSQCRIETKGSMINAFNQNSQDSNLSHVQSKFQQRDLNDQKRISAQSQISSKYSDIKIKDVEIPKILRKIKNKKKKSQENQSKKASNVVCSQVTNNIDCQFYKDLEQINKQALNQKNNLLNELKYQIKLDQQFRKVKKWVQKLKLPDKWNIFLDHLQRNQYQITEQQIKNIFSLHTDQENPFYYPQQGDFTIQDCLKIYLAADRHWKYDVLNNYSHRNLIASNFREQNIDINGKGYINIQDLTRYINCQLDTSYRNRDIYLIYHRFKISDKLQYSTILKCLCNE